MKLVFYNNTWAQSKKEIFWWLQSLVKFSMRRRVWVSTNFTKEPEFLIQTWNKNKAFLFNFHFVFLCCYVWIYDIVSSQVIYSLILKNLPLSCSWWEGNEMYFWGKMTFTSYWHGSFSIAHATCNQELVANTYIVALRQLKTLFYVIIVSLQVI